MKNLERQYKLLKLGVKIDPLYSQLFETLENIIEDMSFIPLETSTGEKWFHLKKSNKNIFFYNETTSHLGVSVLNFIVEASCVLRKNRLFPMKESERILLAKMLFECKYKMPVKTVRPYYVN